MNSKVVKIGDIVEHQGRRFVVTKNERSLFGGPLVYHLTLPGQPNRVHVVPHASLSRGAGWR